MAASPRLSAARFISYIFHPLLLPTMGVFFVYRLDPSGLWLPPPENQLWIYILVFLSTFLFPVLNALLMLKMNVISSLEMDDPAERKFPFLVTAVFFAFATWLVMRADLPLLLKVLMLGSTLVVVGVLIVNIFWKISAHMAGIGGMIGMSIALSARLQINIHGYLIALILIAGLIGAARLALRAHQPSQVYAGFLMGLAIPLLLFL